MYIVQRNASLGSPSSKSLKAIIVDLCVSGHSAAHVVDEELDIPEAGQRLRHALPGSARCGISDTGSREECGPAHERLSLMGRFGHALTERQACLKAMQCARLPLQA